MNTVDPTSCVIATVMEQRNQMLQLAEQCQHDAEERARNVEEQAQHLQLLEMLHSGKIDQTAYDALKP
jgi:pyruvate-formate lyase